MNIEIEVFGLINIQINEDVWPKDKESQIKFLQNILDRGDFDLNDVNLCVDKYTVED